MVGQPRRGMSLRSMTIKQSTGYLIRNVVISLWLLSMAVCSEHLAIAAMWALHALAVTIDRRVYIHRAQAQ